MEKGKENQKEEDEYIKGPDKFPLQPGRWGYLPVGIQKLLHEVNADCQISKTNTNIKQNHPCLLRHGVEVNKKQSFIACISDAIFFGKRIADENKQVSVAKVLTIREMKDRLIKSLTIDNFIKYQNGNLVTDFQNIKSDIDITQYMKNNKLITKLNMDNEHDKSYFKKVISAFENFKNFLDDDDAIIDHTYLWDLISKPNKYLFTTGVNLIIFQLPNDDITNNVQILCPTNHYSIEFYEARKPSIFLLKENNYYEPIFSYTVNKNKLSIAKEFKEYDPQLSKTMRAVFKGIIKPFFTTICKPIDSMPNIYKAKRSLLLFNLVQKLDLYEYKILKLVVNFNNKVIGVLAEEPKTTNVGFVPCYPSAIDENLKKDLDYIFMTDLSLWRTYEETYIFLTKLEKRSKKRKDKAEIPCKPAFKIVEDEMVVGILTETNQFIQLSKPIAEKDIFSEYNIPSIKNDNYIVNTKATPMVSIDVPITTKDNVDQERVDYIKKIKLETNFYNVFRNTIRILLNDYENIKIREKMETEMLNEYIIYSEKLKNMDKMLREIVSDKIQFTGDNNFYKLIDEISTCVVKDKDNCSQTPNLCAVTNNGKCKLILPKNNLMHPNKENESIYYGRMADELIRYNRIKTFMLQPQTYLSFGNIGYNLRDNEIILIQSLLTQEYFETLVPTITNKYIQYNSYDEAEPLITQMYDNTIPSLDHALGRKNEIACQVTTTKLITSGIWKNCFPENYKEIGYNKSHSCTFNVIIDLIEKKTGKKLTINHIKNELYEEYKKYLNNYTDKIVDILIIEGKKTLGDQVKSETLSFSSFIYTDNYFLTMFDLWLLVQKYKIPTIFISKKFIFQTKYERSAFVGYGDKNESFAFIVIPGLRAENVPGYKLIVSHESDVFISLNKFNENCVDKIDAAFDNKVSIEAYLENFVKPVATVYAKKKPIIIEEDSMDEEEKEEKEESRKKAKKETERKKKQLIIEEASSSISPEQTVLFKKGKTKKMVILRGNKKTKRNLQIVDNSSSENIYFN